MSAHVFTCPHCRTIVDYSCMCSVDRSIADFVGHDTVDDAKAHIDANRTLDATARPCGEWAGTPAYLRLLGFPRFRRSIYAHARIGGGWDGFEFDDDHPIAGPTPLPSDSAVWTAFTLAVIAILISAAGVVYYTTGARAHEAPSGWKYDAWCCSNRDCAEIPDKAVRVIPGGYQITVTAGDHPLVTRVHVFQVEQSKARPSPDGKFHLCLYPNEDTLRCFYAPVPGF